MSSVGFEAEVGTARVEAWASVVRRTPGRLRFFDGRLQQEWTLATYWTVSVEWLDVPHESGEESE